MRQISINDSALVVDYPEQRIFAFNPHKAIITGVSPAQEVIITWTDGSIKRYTGIDNKVTLPLMYILKSFFVNTEVGDILPVEVGLFTNLSSKLVLLNKEISVTIGTDTAVLSFDIIWGALQIGQVEPIIETFYKFGTLPLTITQNIGDNFKDSANTYSETATLGKDIYINEMISDGYPTDILLLDSTTLKKTFLISKLSYCPNGVYLRWIDAFGQYKYFQFVKKDSFNDTKVGDSYSKELLSLDPSAQGLYKSQNQLIDIQGNPTEIVGLATASYEVQKHVQSIESSIKVWKYLGDDKWVEVIVKKNPIQLDEMYQQNQSIEMQIILPNLYLQTL